jgi:hypothetical protein
MNDYITKSINQFACLTDLNDYFVYCFNFVDNRDMHFVSMMMLLRHDNIKMIDYEDDNLTCVIMKEIDTKKMNKKEIDTRISFLRFNLILFYLRKHVNFKSKENNMREIRKRLIRKKLMQKRLIREYIFFDLI